VSSSFADSARSEDGQGTVEYAGLVLLVATLLAALAAIAGPAIPGGLLARAVAAKVVCAVEGEDCSAVEADGVRSPLEEAYGPGLAELAEAEAPDIYFEDGDFVSLPVDFRACRKRSCADTIRHGALSRTQTGLQPVAFTHLVDCRGGTEAASGADRYDCGGARAGHVYLQYWLYYPDSRTGPASSLTGGYHLDDWESFQVRVDSSGDAVARASSHHSYNGTHGGLGSISSDAGWRPKAGWDTVLNELHVAAGSHAGMSQALPGDTRHVDRKDLRLIPLEPIAALGGLPDFTISPPWRKGVWRDPESTGT
jgi:hypothetical protein